MEKNCRVVFLTQTLLKMPEYSALLTANNISTRWRANWRNVCNFFRISSSSSFQCQPTRVTLCSRGISNVAELSSRLWQTSHIYSWIKWQEVHLYGNLAEILSQVLFVWVPSLVTPPKAKVASNPQKSRNSSHENCNSADSDESSRRRMPPWSKESKNSLEILSDQTAWKS